MPFLDISSPRGGDAEEAKAFTVQRGSWKLMSSGRGPGTPEGAWFRGLPTHSGGAGRGAHRLGLEPALPRNWERDTSGANENRLLDSLEGKTPTGSR